MIAPLNIDRIESRKGVCGGAHCIRGTRVPVWLLEKYRQLQMDLAEILEDYPFLSEADIRAAWDFAELHKDEIAKQTGENEG